MYYRARNTVNEQKLLHLFDESYDGNQIIIFDTETTGIHPNEDYIVELAAIKVVLIHHSIHTESKYMMDWYLRPPVLMEKKVIAIHGITNEFLQDKPTEKDLFPEIHAFFGDHPIVCGYNVGFDIGMLQSLYHRNGAEFQPNLVLDVLEMAKDIASPEEIEALLKSQLESKAEVKKEMRKPYQLNHLVKLYGLDKDIQFHNALGDTTATLRLLEVLYHEYHHRKASRGNLFTPSINFTYFFEGYNLKQKGVYVDTNLGRIYYNPFYKAWMSTETSLETVDIDEFERQVLNRLGCSLEELGKMTKKKYQALKQQNRVVRQVI